MSVPVVIGDDDVLLREGVRRILSESGLDVVAQQLRSLPSERPLSVMRTASAVARYPDSGC